MMCSLFTVDNLTSLITLTGMEIVLGIDNIVFIGILLSKVPKDQQSRTRRIGLGLALITRLALLFSLTVIMRLNVPFFSIFGKNISAKDLVLVCGGLFLVAKATFEIHLESGSERQTVKKIVAPSKYRS